MKKEPVGKKTHTEREKERERESEWQRTHLTTLFGRVAQCGRHWTLTVTGRGRASMAEAIVEALVNREQRPKLAAAATN